jgi:hypothetical protein
MLQYRWTVPELRYTKSAQPNSANSTTATTSKLQHPQSPDVQYRPIAPGYRSSDPFREFWAHLAHFGLLHSSFPLLRVAGGDRGREYDACGPVLVDYNHFLMLLVVDYMLL